MPRIVVWVALSGRARLGRAGLAAAAAVGLVTACTQAAAPRQAPASPAARSASPSSPAPAAVMARYLDGLTAAGKFSGTVLVARGGQVLIDTGYGLADRATQAANGPGTVFQVGSVTKQFTAMAIAMLAAAGRLRLDGRACDYLPDCPPSWRPVTIAELLTHTSGIANWSSWRLTGPLPGEAADPIAAIVTQAQREPLASRPGTRASYSNPGYVVLGDIIQRVSGMSYAAFLRTRIFTPLGMASTGVYQGGATQRGHALGYLASGAVAPAVLTGYSSAAGAIYSTVGDLDRWDHALITGTPRLIPPPATGADSHRARPLPLPVLPAVRRPRLRLRLVCGRHRRRQADQPLWLSARVLGLQRLLPRPRHHRGDLVQPGHRQHQRHLRPAEPARHSALSTAAVPDGQLAMPMACLIVSGWPSALSM